MLSAAAGVDAADMMFGVVAQAASVAFSVLLALLCLCVLTRSHNGATSFTGGVCCTRYEYESILIYKVFVVFSFLTLPMLGIFSGVFSALFLLGT